MAGYYGNVFEVEGLTLPARTSTTVNKIRNAHPFEFQYFGLRKKLWLTTQRWSSENNNHQDGSEGEMPLMSNNDKDIETKKKKQTVKYILNSNISADSSDKDNTTLSESSSADSEDNNTDGASYWNFEYHIDFKKQKSNVTSTTASNAHESVEQEKEKEVAEKESSTGNNESSNGNKTVKYSLGVGKHEPIPNVKEDRRRIVTQDDEGRFLTGALWMYPKNQKNNEKSSNDPNDSIVDDIIMAQDEVDYDIHDESHKTIDTHESDNSHRSSNDEIQKGSAKKKKKVIQYKDIDLSIPNEVYDCSKGIDHVWDLLKYEAKREAAREPLLVSFLYANIINHSTLESALAFYLANRLASPAMISTQIMSLIQEALDHDPYFRRALRADIMAVRDRDPACSTLTDVFMYFKGFHALTTHRVAHYLWHQNRHVLAHFLQSRVSTTFQIDIHPNATMGTGIMLDHGTGIVIGETAVVGNNCSILHHVTLGGSGKKGVDRHPKVGNGVLLGAGCSVLGNINIGDGCQVGAGTLVITDLPPHSVAVGVPARIIGTFLDSKAQPSTTMNQLGTKESNDAMQLFTYESEGI